MVCATAEETAVAAAIARSHRSDSTHGRKHHHRVMESTPKINPGVSLRAKPFRNRKELSQHGCFGP
jgi:hypothetical protein